MDGACFLFGNWQVVHERDQISLTPSCLAIGYLFHYVSSSLEGSIQLCAYPCDRRLCVVFICTLRNGVSRSYFDLAGICLMRVYT